MEDVASVLNYFNVRLVNLRKTKERIDLLEIEPPFRQGLVLEMAGVEAVICAMIAMLTEILEGTLQPE